MQRYLQQKNKIAYFKYIIALVFTAAYFIFNFTFMQRSIDHDDVIYTVNIQELIKYNKNFYNPHHMHFELSGKHFHKIIKKYFSKSGFTNLMFNLRLRSLIFASTGIFFIIILLYRLTSRITWGIIGGLLTGFSHGYVYYSTKVDTGIFPVSWLPLVLLIFLMLFKSKEKYKVYFYSLILGLTNYIGIMLHQYFILVTISTLIALLIPSSISNFKPTYKLFYIKQKREKPAIDKSFKLKFISILLFLFIAVTPTLLSYIYAGKVKYGLSSDSKAPSKIKSVWQYYSFQQFLLAYKMNKEWGKGFKKTNKSAWLMGFTESFIVPIKGNKYQQKLRFNFNLNKFWHEKYVFHNLLLVFISLIIFLNTLFLPALLIKYKRFYVLLLLCLILFSILGVYWEPYYLEFWLIPALLFIINSLLIFNMAGEKILKPLNNAKMLPVYTAALIFTLTLSMYNVKNQVIKHSVHMKLEGVYGLKKEMYNWLLYSNVYKHPYRPYRRIIKKQYLHRR